MDGANESGKLWEKRLDRILRNKGFEVLSHKDFLRLEQRLPTKFAVRNYPYNTAYHCGKRPKKADRFICNDGHTCVVEMKSQKVAGSVGEKISNLIINAYYGEHSFRNRSINCFFLVFEDSINAKVKEQVSTELSYHRRHPDFSNRIVKPHYSLESFKDNFQEWIEL